MEFHLVSASPVSIPVRRAQKHVGEASINSPPDNAQHPASRAMKHVRQDVSEPLYRVIRWYIPATCNRAITTLLIEQWSALLHV